VRQILQGMGLEFAEKPSDKSTYFTFQLASYKVRLESRNAFMELQLALSDKVSTASMNEWNRLHRFTRAYMDTDGGATLEADLDYTGGVTKSTVESFIKGFRDVVPEFTKVVLNAEGGATDSRPAATGGGTGGTGYGGTSAGILSMLDGRMSVRYDPAKWKSTASEEIGRYEFTHTKGDGFAVVIAERTAIPTDAIADVAFQNIKKQDPSAKLVTKQKRRISGVDVWFQIVEATTNRIPVTYYGYYYGGQFGTVQVLTYTGRNLASDYEKDFLEFLNGFRVAF
jgi:hypothetical protein